MSRRAAFILGIALTACGESSTPSQPESADAAPEGDAADDGNGCVDGAPVNLSQHPATDEDGSFIVADDGTLFFAFMSERSGSPDIWMTSSPDGVTWADPWPVVATPGDDLTNYLTRTSDGLYHLTGRIENAVADATSTDLITWSTPVTWTDPLVTGRASGTFAEDANGDYWLVSIANGNPPGPYKLSMRRSTDRGASWSDPVALTNHAQEDYIWAFRIADDGTFLLVWEQHDVGAPFGSPTSSIFYATSQDGSSWSPPEELTPDPGEQFFDMWPWLLVDAGGQYYATWSSARGAAELTALMAPVYPMHDPTDVRIVPATGYSVRSQTLPGGGALIAWVQDKPSDYFYRFVCDFDFPKLAP
jgi:hypothetical protein